MKKACLITLSFLVLGLTACRDIHHMEKPKNLIPEDKMVHVLVDLLKISAAQNYSYGLYKKREVSGEKLIYKKYSIDSTQFKKSTAYYAQQFKVNKRIYNRVRSILKQQGKRLDSLIKVKKKKAKAKADKTLTIKKEETD